MVLTRSFSCAAAFCNNADCSGVSGGGASEALALIVVQGIAMVRIAKRANFGTVQVHFMLGALKTRSRLSLLSNAQPGDILTKGRMRKANVVMAVQRNYETTSMRNLVAS